MVLKKMKRKGVKSGMVRVYLPDISSIIFFYSTAPLPWTWWFKLFGVADESIGIFG